MVGLASLPYPFAAFSSHKAQTRPRKLDPQCSIRVHSSAPSRLTKRKNYLRPKILKTLNKPYPIPPPTPDEPETPIESVEPSLEVPFEPGSGNLDCTTAEQSEMLVNVDESDSGQVPVVQASQGQNVVGFSWFSGRMVVKIVASFVGLFVLQTVVAVWVMGNGDVDEKERNSGIPGRDVNLQLGLGKVEMGLNGNGFQGNRANLNMDEMEIEAKIAEIRKMAREARELEKKSSENGEGDMGDVSDDDDDDEDEVTEAETSRIRSGIVKEVDGRLTKLKKRSPTQLLNVNFLNKAQDSLKERKNEGVKNEENDMLMFEMKHKFRSQLTGTREKPKGFQSNEVSRDIREKSSNMNNEQAIKRNGNSHGNNAGSSDEERELNGLENKFSEWKNDGSQLDEKKPGSQSSSSYQSLKKRSASNGRTTKLKKGRNRSASSRASKKTSGSNSAIEKSNMGVNEGAKPERGVVQDSSHANPVDQATNLEFTSSIATQNSKMKLSDLKSSATSEELGSALPMKKIKDKQEIDDPESWWLTLPYVIVILMRKGSEGEGLEGFYTLRMQSDAENQSYTPYIVAFEAPNDARNFSYLLESVFEDLPDAAIDIVPLSTKELKQLAESHQNKVVVVKKGQVRLYAGQTLDEVETALKSLVK